MRRSAHVQTKNHFRMFMGGQYVAAFIVEIGGIADYVVPDGNH